MSLVMTLRSPVAGHFDVRLDKPPGIEYEGFRRRRAARRLTRVERPAHGHESRMRGEGRGPMEPLWESLHLLGNLLIFVGPPVLCGAISARIGLGCRTAIGAFFASVAGSIGLMILLGPMAGIAFEVFNPLGPDVMCCVPRALVVGVWEIVLSPVMG